MFLRTAEPADAAAVAAVHVRERLRRAEDPTFKKGTLKELVSLTESFEGTARRVEELSKERLANLPPGSDPPEAFQEAMQRVARTIFYGSAWDETEEGEAS